MATSAAPTSQSPTSAKRVSVAGYQHAGTTGFAPDPLKVAESFRPDVIVMDIGLPNLTGYEVARRIRGQPWGKDIVLIALTGWGQAESRNKSREAGFNHHLVKSVETESLARLLSECCGRKATIWTTSECANRRQP